MHELWWAGKAKRIPVLDPISKLGDSDRAHILEVCSADFRPEEFGSANTLRLASWRHFQDLGFTSDQSAVLVGMMFNMVGRPDL
jgi:hypothetical protein